MWSAIALLPVLAVLCHGVALPHTTPTVDARQVLGNPTRSVPVAPTWSSPGWPWWPQSIVTVTITQTVTQFPDTLTAVSTPKTTPFSPTNDYYTPGVTRTVPPLSVPLERREPQVLGSPTRTVLDSPTPDPTVTVTVTVTTTYFPTEPWHPWPTKPSPPWHTTRYPTSDPAPTTRTVPPLPVTINRRDPQVLGSPTRTVLLSPTPLSTEKPHTTKKPTTTSKWVDVEKRQDVNDPTASVSWYTAGDDGLTATVTLASPNKRQVLGDPTGSVTWWTADDSRPTIPVILEPPTNRAEARRNRP